MEYQDFRIESAGGRKLHAWLFPSGKGAEERGTLVQFHGNAENISTHFISLSWVTTHGYNFITFDYSGYWDSDSEPGRPLESRSKKLKTGSQLKLLSSCVIPNPRNT
jgi:cephalosporin-C deacetylase-like acetyl esterase